VETESEATYVDDADEAEIAERSAKAEQDLEALGRNLTKSQSPY
jgi:hypothetical protein